MPPPFARTIVATAEQIYVDPSALALLYLHQPGSREMTAWRTRLKGSLPVTHHGRIEVVNAIALACFRKVINGQQAADAWGTLDSDFTEGRLSQADVLWRAALNKASELSRRYSPSLGTRALDVLHVSCALELKLRSFLTFDERQQSLAKAVGLKLVSV